MCQTLDLLTIRVLDYLRLLKCFLRDKNISLEDYLVRKDIVVIIDGDEYCELDKLIDCGLIDKDSIVLRYPRSN